jgi:hypothetical protein
MPSQALVKPSGNSFLAILASASEEQAPGSGTMEADPNADASGAEGDPNEQAETALPARTLSGDGRSGVNQHIAQKSDSTVQNAGVKEQDAGTSTGSRPAVRADLRSEASNDAKAVSASAVPVLDSSALATVQAPAVSSLALNGNASESAVVPAGITSSTISGIQPLFASVRDAGTLSSGLTATDATSRPGVMNPSNSSMVNGVNTQPAAATISTVTPVDKLTSAIANGQQNQMSFVVSPVITRPGSTSTPDAQAGSTATAKSSADVGAASQSADANTSGKETRSDAGSADRANAASVTAAQNFVPAQLISRALPDIQSPETMTGPVKHSTATTDPVLSSDDTAAAATTTSKSPDTAVNLTATIAGPAALQQLVLPVVPALPAAGSSNLAASNGAAKASPNAASAKSTAAASSIDGTSSTADNGNGPVDGNSHGAQSNGQTAQDAQADPSQTAGAVAKAADSGATHAQAQMPVAAAATPAAASTHRTQDGSDASSGLSEQQAGTGTIHSENGEPVAASSINTAKLMQTMSESEMRVGMRSSEFGEISIRTSVSQQQMVAQISLDHSDLSQAIAAHVSTVQTKLGDEYGIHASIEVHNLGSPLANNAGQSSQREQRDFVRSTRPGIALPAVEESSSVHLAAAANVSNGNRLDIRA